MAGKVQSETLLSYLQALPPLMLSKLYDSKLACFRCLQVNSCSAISIYLFALFFSRLYARPLCVSTCPMCL